jgi:aspartyl-tRNA(Asn)/glutamyl-tRNA(Gln) amidotransferase subunit C
MAQVSGPYSSNAEASLRDDVLRPCLPHVDAMKNAPETDGEFFKVPKVIEK